MRRWVGAAALGCAAAMVLGGCGNPAGVDGNLTDDWAAVSNAVSFVPEAGVCHPDAEQTGGLSAYHPLDCGQPHRMETLYVGAFTGANASTDSPPETGSRGMRDARSQCDRKADEVLGGDWHGARIEVKVLLPTLANWTGGARWFRCDATEVASLEGTDPVDHTGSLKGALRGASNLAYGCYVPKVGKEEVEQMKAVACTAKHRSEFAGIFTAPDTSYAAFEKDPNRTHSACMGVIAKFAGVPNDGNLKYRAGSIYFYPNEDAWRNGNRAVQCFLWIDDRDLTRSMRGAGPGALPIS